jgi:prepilin-type N-terminal cleavage/methylation domain-containing protein
MRLKSHRESGFSLVEIAVVLVIVGLLIGGLLAPLAMQMDQRNFTETQKRLDNIREELLGFAIANGRLPCPASTSSNGDESPSGGGTCTNYYDGFVPAKALGLQQLDSSGYALDGYNNRIRYVLAQTVSGCPATPAFSSSTNMKSNGLQCLPSDLLVCKSSQVSGFNSTSCGTGTNSLVNANTVVAIVFSEGKNGATTDSSRTDELANTDANATFVYHTPSPSGATGGEYDDLMVWLSAGLLYGRMVNAGVLP